MDASREAQSERRLTRGAKVAVWFVVACVALSVLLLVITDGYQQQLPNVAKRCMTAYSCPSGGGDNDLDRGLLPPQRGEQWSYLLGAHDLTGKTGSAASLFSVNTTNKSFPYQRQQYATLRLRKHPCYGRTVIFSIEEGQFRCGIDACELLVAFDRHTPVRFSAARPDDHSADTLFIKNYRRFVDRLQKSSEVRIIAPVYYTGRPTSLFFVAAFDADPVKPSTGSR